MSTVRPVLEAVCAHVMADLPAILAQRRTVTWKPDGSPVTAADVRLEREIHGLLEGRLGPVNLIGEESYDPAAGVGTASWTAVLDPIDGTENFCSGLKEWGVSLSLWRDGGHEGSLLLLPELGERMMTGEAIERHTSRITGFSSSITPELAQQLVGAGEARILGCAVYNLYNVVRGSLARFANPKGAKSWDLMAGLMLAKEHGCDVTVEGRPYDGSYLEPDRRHRFDIRHRYDLHPG